MEYVYRTQGTCSSAIRFNIDGDTITNVEFYGGCPGNTQAVARLVHGMTVGEIESKLCGISCGGKPTSCADQLARAVREAWEKTKAGTAHDSTDGDGPAYAFTKGPFV